ncbi:MAG: hypothetical protein ABI595_15240 [Actinomycetota bacterium]
MVELAGLADEFGATGILEVVERLEGIGMTDYYGVSGRSAGPEYEQMSDAECERKIALLRAFWAYFDDVASGVSAELRKSRPSSGRVPAEEGATEPGLCAMRTARRSRSSRRRSA